jgi:O-antigen ligase
MKIIIAVPAYNESENNNNEIFNSNYNKNNLQYKSGGKDIYFDKDYKLSEYRCATHPHQIYFEFLSELGFFGLIIMLFFIIYISLKSFYFYFKNRNLVLLSTTLFVCSTFIPLIPSGSFFTSFGATIFWLNIGILISNLNKR